MEGAEEGYEFPHSRCLPAPIIGCRQLGAGRFILPVFHPLFLDSIETTFPLSLTTGHSMVAISRNGLTQPGWKSWDVGASSETLNLLHSQTFQVSVEPLPLLPPASPFPRLRPQPFSSGSLPCPPPSLCVLHDLTGVVLAQPRSDWAPITQVRG